jgi:hypothetical protein
MIAQAIEQRRTRLNVERMFSSIDRELNAHGVYARAHGTGRQ